METALSAPFLACREALTGDRPHRVWSLIITIFGDMAQGEGQQLTGADLSRITEAIGVKPEAMRVALHRLRKDGWIESHRDGRASVHQLTGFGRQQSADASPRIYGCDLSEETEMHVLIAEDNAASIRRMLDAHGLADDYVHPGGNVLIGSGPPPQEACDLVVSMAQGIAVPDWLRQKICPPEQVRESEALLSALQTVRRQIDSGVEMPALERQALRVLIVHSWRRFLFRHPNLPTRFFPENWRGPACRHHVRAFLDELPID